MPGPEVFYALLVSLVFYVVIPLSGAFSVRHRWRIFRQQVIDASISKEVTYADPERKHEGSSGKYCFAGELQAIQDNNSIWLSNGKVSVRAEMRGIRLYLLPTSQSMEREGRIEENKFILSQDMPKRISWERVYSLAQGTGVVLSGKVFIENGTPVFRNTEECPLLVIIYDGNKESVLRRSIWSGRQLNEYWNNLTPLSIIAGSFFLFVLTFIAYRNGSNDVATITIVLSFLPVMPFVPPGLVFYFIFRKLWRSGRYLRGERDLLRLPLRHHFYEECISCSDVLERYPDIKIRSCGVIADDKLMSLECRVFSVPQDADTIFPAYFFEKVAIPGDPENLARRCRSRARIMEILAAASISFGFIINILLIYFVILWFI